MKNIIALVSLFIAAITVQAQQIDTTVKCAAAVALKSPVQPVITDTLKATHLTVKIISDDLKGIAVLHWQLITENCYPLLAGNAEIKGQDYANWNGNNLFPFVFVAQRLKIPLKQ